jgi:SAM-dependent methyltransferase
MDNRLQDIKKLLNVAPLNDVTTVLDIGAGQGQLAKYFSELGKKVTCTGVQINSYVSDVDSLHDKYGIEYIECDIESMPFPDCSFDMVVLSHVLEHCPNVSSALGHVRRVLNNGGLLLVFVPPVEDVVCAGHISVGWNVGQLMYVLLLNGFDVRSGNFIEYGYNVCGFVRRTERLLPSLRFDQGDISTLIRNDWFPTQIGCSNVDNFNGNIRSVNWPNVSDFRAGIDERGLKRFIILVVKYVIPSSVIYRIGNSLLRLGRLFVKISDQKAGHSS